MEILSVLAYIIGIFIIINAIKVFIDNIKSANNHTITNKESSIKKLFATGVFMLLIGWFIWPSDKKSKKDVSKLDVDAYVISQDFIKRQLKAPATADFPLGSDGHVEYRGDSVFYIHSYVDAQNSFGANIRSNYAGTVKYTGNDNWNNIDLQLTER